MRVYKLASIVVLKKYLLNFDTSLNFEKNKVVFWIIFALLTGGQRLVLHCEYYYE